MIIIKWIAVIFGIIAALALGWLAIALVGIKRESKKFAADNPPPEGVLPLLAFGNILFGLNSGKTLYLEEDKQDTIDDLKDYWSITNRTSAIETLRWLLDSGHRARYQSYFAPLMANDRKALEEVITERFYGEEDEEDEDEENEPIAELFENHQEDDEEAEEDNDEDDEDEEDEEDEYVQSPEKIAAYVASEVNRAFKQFGTYKRMLRLMGFTKREIAACKSFHAWDYDRAAATARYSLMAGYITEPECIALLKEVAGRSTAEFASWREFSLSYLIGRAICYNARNLKFFCLGIILRLKRRKSLWNQFPLSRETYDVFTEDWFAGSNDNNAQNHTHPQIEYLRRQAEDLMAQKYGAEDESGWETEDEREMNEAVAEQALELYRQIIALAQQNHLSGEYYPALNVYMTEARELGDHYIETLQFEKAAATFRRMKAVAATVTDNKRCNEYMAEAIGGINNTGAACGESGMERQSLELFLEAMNDYWQLSEAVPELLADVAMLQSNIGYLYILSGSYGKAGDILHKALGTYRYIREKNIKGYTPDRDADVYTNIGLLHLHLGEDPKACKAFGRACKLYRRALRRAAAGSKDEIRASYATALSNLSAAYPPLKRITFGMAALRKSMRIRRRLVKDYPDENEFRSDLSDCYLNLGKTQTLCLMLRRATNHFKAAIALREPLAAADPDRYLQPLAAAYFNIATLCSARPFYQLRNTNQLELWGYCMKALAAFAKLKEKGEDGNTLDIAGMNALAGEVCMNMHEYATAQDHMMDALLQYHEIEKELDCNDWLQMMDCMVAMAELLNRKNDKHNATVMLRNLGQRYRDAPEAYRQKSEKLRKSIAQLAGVLQP